MKINTGSISFTTRYDPEIRFFRIIVGPLTMDAILTDKDRDYDHLNIASTLRALANSLDELP